MHEERAGGGGKYFTALMVGMVPVWGLSWLLFGGPPTGVFGWVLGAVAFALGYVVSVSERPSPRWTCSSAFGAARR